MSKVPTTTEVLTELLRDEGKGDDYHWVLFNNGTFYTFPKKDLARDFSGDDLVAQALEMSKTAHLLNYQDWDCVAVQKIDDIYKHPVYMILSGLRQKIAWIVVGKTEKWAETDQELSAVGYLARTKYEMDCEENKIIATSFPWSAE